ncbi:putative metallopeptidase, M16 family protein [Polaribacter irgensii 23-P]|uniref:Putative metallopeptidase, M16 family protein n=1 Tax=Polaribacter irgensii 23-P TaxID=313594 RepID=A4BXJ8_9FLAO|nr:pitrilysin family protein [Polaribacter irgensii]EAR13689.1 putative metallopeptidase, M16 family protein [Polaribacter irgensii 23-P]
MKTKILAFIVLFVATISSNAQIDRSTIPKAGPDPVIKLGVPVKFNMSNGLKVILVENHKLPRVSANLSIDNTPYFEGEIAGVSGMMGSLLGRGTANITKDEFNEKVDFLGANISFYSAGGFASSLEKYFPEILSLMADGIKNATFTQEEFDKEVQLSLDGLKSNEKSVTSVARRVENVLTYGRNHPFGEFTSKESVKKITLADVENNYNTYLKPNNAILVVEGDIDIKETKKLVKSLFADWKAGEIPSYTMPEITTIATAEIDFINMDNAVQSEIAIINTVDITLGDADYYAALLANKILGGGGTARLFMNLREDKGYTYGSYSSLSQSKYVGTFRASASVRNMVTDSSVVELQKEINKIRYQTVSAEELENAKESYIGSFVMDVQKPRTVANFALNIERYNLPANFYESYIQKIKAVTLEEVQNAAITYFTSDKARIIITGKGIDVLANLEKTDYVINYFDVEGNPTQKPAMTLPIPEGMTASSIVDKYIAAIGGKDKVMAVKTTIMTANATIQGTPLVMTMKAAAPNKTSQEISVMGNSMQKTVFNGSIGYTNARGQKKDMTEAQVNEAKSGNAIFNDLEYSSGELLRIEPLEGKNAIVLKFNDTEVYYDMTSGLKVKEVKTEKTPDGQEVKIPTVFSNYKEVDGVKFPYSIGIKSGPMNLDFVVKEIKVNEGVSDADFE